jgi:hypothetical protein
MRYISIILLLTVITGSLSHNLLFNWKYYCEADGSATKISFMLFNDYWPNATFSTISGFTGCTGNPSNYGPIKMGPTTGCNWVHNRKQKPEDCTPSGRYNSKVPAYGDPNCGSACIYPDYVFPITKDSRGRYNPITLCGSVVWSDDYCMCNIKGLNAGKSAWKQTYTPNDVDIQKDCHADDFKCPSLSLLTHQCGIESCRCNSFTFTNIRTDQVSHMTQISVNVTNQCSDSFYYAAFGLNNGLSLVSATGSYQGTNYAGWTVQYVDGTQSNTHTSPAIKWVRFVWSVTDNGNSQMTKSGSKNWEIFTFTVSGYTAAHQWTVQGHQGGKWDTYTNLDTSFCPCTGCDSTTTNGCPAGFSGDNCQGCDNSPPPSDGSYTWLCVASGNPNNPYTLMKIPTNKIGSSGYQIPPNFIPSAVDGPIVDDQGYRINCNCSRIVHDCSDLDYCSGTGTCFPQNGTCSCPPDTQGPNCSPIIKTPTPTTTESPTTTEPPTTTESPTTPPETTPSETHPGSTEPETSTPDTTTVTPTMTPPVTVQSPCYNDGFYCSGHGTCQVGVCICSETWTGEICNVTVKEDEKYCNDFINCHSCLTQTLDLECSWCADVSGGGCVNTDSCLNRVMSCGAEAVSFIPEPCPDSCSGTNGICVNQTCDELHDSGLEIPIIEGVPVCINTSLNSQEDPENNETIIVTGSHTSFCLCYSGYGGANCGHKSDSLGTALAISGAVIAVICVAGVIALIIIGLGAKKGIDWVSMQQQSNANFKNNPLGQERDQHHTNALYE